jgi:hypothetical protein
MPSVGENQSHLRPARGPFSEQWGFLYDMPIPCDGSLHASSPLHTDWNSLDVYPLCYLLRSFFNHRDIVQVDKKTCLRFENHPKPAVLRRVGDLQSIVVFLR